MTKQFCNYGEFLMFVNSDQGRYIHETDMSQMSAKEAALEADDTIDAIIRMDRCTWKGEDVTEEVAMAWLTSDMVDPADPSKFPLYVRNSEALETYSHAYREEKAAFLAMQAQGVA